MCDCSNIKLALKNFIFKYLKKYKDLYKDLQACALNTSIFIFIFYLLLFLGLSFASSPIVASDYYPTRFEKYLILANGLYMLIQFGIATLLIYLLLQFREHVAYDNKDVVQIEKYTIIWQKLHATLSICYVIINLASGIYLTIKGTLYIGILVIIATILLIVLKSHTEIIIYYFTKDEISILVAPVNTQPNVEVVNTGYLGSMDEPPQIEPKNSTSDQQSNSTPDQQSNSASDGEESEQQNTVIEQHKTNQSNIWMDF